jgi:hypothetical protein
MGVIHSRGSGAGRPIGALAPVEQTMIWTLRHAAERRAAKAARTGELARHVRDMAPFAERAACDLVDLSGGALASLGDRVLAAGEERLLAAAAAVQANRPAATRRLLAPLAGPGLLETLTGCLVVFALVFEAAGARLGAHAGATPAPVRH